MHFKNGPVHFSFNPSPPALMHQTYMLSFAIGNAIALLSLACPGSRRATFVFVGLHCVLKLPSPVPVVFASQRFSAPTFTQRGHHFDILYKLSGHKAIFGEY